MKKVKRFRVKKHSYDELHDLYKSNPTAFLQKENNDAEEKGFGIDEIDFVPSNLIFKLLILIHQEDVDIPVFDTTRIHAMAAADFALNRTNLSAP